jgi:hypothetical protein
MAVHRRPLVEGPPVGLVVFRRDDWISDDGVLPLERCHKARFAWAKAHSDDSVWVGICSICFASELRIGGACSRDPYSAAGFRPSRLCSVVHLENLPGRFSRFLFRVFD